MSKPICAIAGRRRAAVANVPCFGRPFASAVALRPREHLIPRGEQCAGTVDPEPARFRRGHQIPYRIGPQHRREIERRFDAGRQRCVVVAQGVGGGLDRGRVLLRHDRDGPVEDRRRTRDVVGQILGTLAGLDLREHRVMPGQVRVGERLDGELPWADGVRLDRGVPPSGAVVDRRHPGRRALAVGTAPGDDAAERVVTLAIGDRADRHVFADDGLGRVRATVDGRTDVLDREATFGHRRGYRGRRAGVGSGAGGAGLRRGRRIGRGAAGGAAGAALAGAAVGRAGGGVAAGWGRIGSSFPTTVA